MGLVKQIEVDSIVSENAMNEAFIHLESINATKTRIKDRGDRKKVNLRKGFEADPKFLQIWEKIKFPTRYRVEYRTDELITLTAKEIKRMPETRKPAIKSIKKRS